DDACSAGTCVHTPNTAACSDGDACTTADRCAAGQCRGGPAPDCNDQNACTTDACSPATGCTHTPVPGCVCQASACTTCRDQCATAATSCSDGCWGTFNACLNGCTTTYCAPFCQVDLGRCLAACPTAPPCQAACDAANGCGAACAPLTPPDDAHGDGVADGADNCVADANPDQSDVDGDGAGDVCDDDDGPLTLAQAMLRPATAGASNGRVTMSGTYLATGTTDWMDPAAELAVAVGSGDGMSLAVTWPVGTCSGRGSRTICRTSDRAATASFVSLGAVAWK